MHYSIGWKMDVDNSIIDKQQYDGFYFLPLEGDEDSLHLSYFELKEEQRGEPVEKTSVGDMFHVIMFKSDDEGLPILDDCFEAILGDPSKYIENLVGARIYGCVLRKTDKSGKWVEDYLTGILGKVMIRKLKFYANSISNSK